MDDPALQKSLNIPSLLAFVVISFFAIRYLFFSSASTTTSMASTAGAGSIGRAIAADRIEQVVTMFPQVSRRDVEWDLLRNGGSVQATTERVLREGRLPAPPPNFRAQPGPATTSSATSNSTSTTTSRSAPQKPAHPDLITRYNLASRISSSSSGAPATVPAAEDDAQGEKKAAAAWSQNKAERQALLAQRRDEMVLAARRKMEERERKGKEKAGA